MGIGALIGIVVIIIDEVLKKTTKKMSLPGLAVGMGMYLPISITLTIPIGALLGMVHDKWAAKQKDPEKAKRMGTLVATGLIVGESLWGVVYAGIVGFSGKDAPLAFMPDSFAGVAQWLGLVVFAGVIGFLYSKTRKDALK